LFAETLRKYPPASPIFRTCTKEYQIPDTDITLEKGTIVLIPVEAIQNDPKYFNNPEEFNPDRFSPEEKQNRTEFSYFPFGEGPRICIGK
jgi:cytochrome P450 family 6